MPSECRPRNAIVVEPDERERKLYGDHPWRTNIGHRNTGNPEVGQRPLDHDVTIQQCRQATHRTTAWSVLRSAIWNGETSDAGSRAALGRVRPRVHYCSQARPGTYGSCERTTAERCDEMYLVDHDRLEHRCFGAAPISCVDMKNLQLLLAAQTFFPDRRRSAERKAGSARSAGEASETC
jgi:hypothetical protein